MKAVELIDKVLDCLPQKHPAYAWAIMLAKELNRAEPCSKCNGKGTHLKHEYCGHNHQEAWIRGCNTQVICRKCKGDCVVPKAKTTPGAGDR